MANRLVYFDESLPGLPEELLLARDRGSVLFITGSGISKAEPSNLPDFRGLVIQLYEKLDPVLAEKFRFIAKEENKLINQRKLIPNWEKHLEGLNENQQAELKRFYEGDYDVVLGMLERRVDETPKSRSMRNLVSDLLSKAKRPNALHRSLVRLGNRFGRPFIATTNFDRLLEASIPNRGDRISYALGAIPRPSRRAEFCGVFHIHGSLSDRSDTGGELVLTDQDFGDVYLRRRVTSDFIYDAARIFNLVLVGYSLGDAPMRYMLNAIAGDETHFTDIKARFAFVPVSEYRQMTIADWRNRGIVPIPYDSSNNHLQLRVLLEKWSASIPTIEPRTRSEEKFDLVTRKPISGTSESARSIFRYIVRRSRPSERMALAARLAKQRCHFSWLSELNAIVREDLEGAI